MNTNDKNFSPTMNSSYTIQLTNDLNEIERLHDFISTICGNHSISEEVQFALNISLDEVVTNVINYGYDDLESHVIDLHFSVGANSISVKVSDNGKAFNPIEQADPDINMPLEQRQIGGLGIFLVRKFMDDISYERINGRNILSLRKAVRL